MTCAVIRRHPFDIFHLSAGHPPPSAKRRGRRVFQDLQGLGVEHLEKSHFLLEQGHYKFLFCESAYFMQSINLSAKTEKKVENQKKNCRKGGRPGMVIIQVQEDLLPTPSGRTRITRQASFRMEEETIWVVLTGNRKKINDDDRSTGLGTEHMDQPDLIQFRALGSS
jgi:hypothetical protein